MKPPLPPGYGETHPRASDDRVPVLLIVLDGLGDRPIGELGGRTPAEAAPTPNLDALAEAGINGWHLPFGWGPAPSSEVAHWAMFGYGEVPFPGRAVLEALGAGIAVEPGHAVTYGALRTSRPDPDGRLWITGRAAAADHADVDRLWAELAPVLAQAGLRADPVGVGAAVLRTRAPAVGAVTDSDPFFESLHPWLLPRPAERGAAAFADTLAGLLPRARACLVASPVNRARLARGLPALDVLTTKWSGTCQPVPAFVDQVGVAGAAVTSSGLYRGLARLLGLAAVDGVTEADPGREVAGRLAVGLELIRDGAQFVHVHTKATDEAGHTKDPTAKRDVLAALDAGLAALLPLARELVVAVTGDHATPSTHGLLHAGEPTPLVVAGAAVRPDPVQAFGEAPAAEGWLGQVRAADLLPLLFGAANRPAFLGHRISPHRLPALADDPPPLRVPLPGSPG